MPIRPLLPRLLLLGVSLVVALLLADLLLLARPPQSPLKRRLVLRERAARNLGLGFDRRSTAQASRDLRAMGINAWPAATFESLRFSASALRDSLTPLAGISGILTVLCSEYGRHVVYRSDERGFRNPAGLWNRPVRIALVGDSYTAGQCTVDSLTVGARVRAREPLTLSVGYPGSGQIAQLALIREYLADVRPAAVVWIYFEGNDLHDLHREANHPILRRYTEPGFRQGLAARQGEIDSQLTASLDSEMRRQTSQESLPRNRNAVQEAVAVLKLFHLRVAVAQWTRRGSPDPCCEFDLFERVVRAGRDEVRQWGGRVLFVYVPASNAFDAPGSEPRITAAYPDVMRVVCGLGLDVLDLRRILTARPDREAMYPRPRYTAPHFTSAGYRAFGDELVRWLEQVGALENIGAPTRGAPTACS